MDGLGWSIEHSCVHGQYLLFCPLSTSGQLADTLTSTAPLVPSEQPPWMPAVEEITALVCMNMGYISQSCSSGGTGVLEGGHGNFEAMEISRGIWKSKRGTGNRMIAGDLHVHTHVHVNG